MLIVLLLRLDVSICQELSLRLIIEKRSELTTVRMSTFLLWRWDCVSSISYEMVMSSNMLTCVKHYKIVAK